MGKLPESPVATSSQCQGTEKTTIDTVIRGDADVTNVLYNSCLGEEPSADYHENSKLLSMARKELLKNLKKLREMDKIQAQVSAGVHVDPLQLKKIQGRAEVEGKVQIAQNLVNAEDIAKREEDAGGQLAATNPELDQWWLPSDTSAEAVLAEEVCPPAAEAVSHMPFQASFTVWHDPSVQWSPATTVPESWPPPAAEIASMIHQAQLQAEERVKPQGGWMGAGFRRHEGRGSQRRWNTLGPVRLEHGHPHNHAMALASLAESLQAVGSRRKQAVAELSGTMLQRSLHPQSCRDVQLALTLLDRRTSGNLVEELHGHVRELVGSPFGNYVIQKVIEVMTPEQASFVVVELHGAAIITAKHRYGCRILCRLLEHSTGGESLAILLDELLLRAETLCKHPFAHHVIQSVLEYGRPEHRRRVCQALCSNPICYACDRHGSFVIEAAFANCAPEYQEALAAALLPCGLSSILALAKDRFGSHAIRAILKSPMFEYAALVLLGIQQSAAHILEAKHGRQLLQDVGIIDSIGAAASNTPAAIAAAAGA